MTLGVNSNTLENLKSALTNKGEWDKISIVYETGKEENK